MKRKEKGITILGLSVLMCSLFLVAIPVTAIAAGQDDYVLGIYGNANEDDTIDMRDLTYVKLIFFGKKPETELADAKYDGKINPLDFIQIKLIIVGTEKELTVIDALDRIETVKKPVERIICDSARSYEIIRAIGVGVDRVVGVGAVTWPSYAPELIGVPLVGGEGYGVVDCENVLALEPDFFIGKCWGRKPHPSIDKLKTTVPFYHFDHTVPNKMGDWKKLGYILDEKDGADEFIDWYEGHMDNIEDRTEGLSEDEKPLMYMGWHYSGTDTVHGKDCYLGAYCIIAGGINIAEDIKGTVEVDPEWVLVRNPDMVVLVFYSESTDYEHDDPTALKEFRDTVMSRPGWENINAVKDGRVYILSWTMYAGSHLLFTTAYMAKWAHPDPFEDLDPKAIHQEYLTRFCGLDYDLDEHGVFVYP
jgi:iron complex transport system substrate-binding protein